MYSLPTDIPVTDRALWLAELSQALGDAQKLLFELDISAHRLEAGELFHRIEAAQMEVRSLQLGRNAQPRHEEHPKWSDFTPWPCEMRR